MKNIKPIVLTSLFWISIAGVIVLLQFVSNTSYNRGVLKGIQEVQSTIVK